jgi:hypothetical protein
MQLPTNLHPRDTGIPAQPDLAEILTEVDGWRRMRPVVRSTNCG